MEILGLSIIAASALAAVGGLGIRNLLGYLKSNPDEPFDIRQAISSALIGLLVGIPAVVIVFETAFGELESLPETTQLILFLSQVATIGGLDAFAKGSIKAARVRAQLIKTKKE